jgi:hypothetical protein
MRSVSDASQGLGTQRRIGEDETGDARARNRRRAASTTLRPTRQPWKRACATPPQRPKVSAERPMGAAEGRRGLPINRCCSSGRRPDDAFGRRCLHRLGPGWPSCAARPRHADCPKGSAWPRSRRSDRATLRHAAPSVAAPGRRRIGHSDSRRWACSTGHRSEGKSYASSSLSLKNPSRVKPGPLQRPALQAICKADAQSWVKAKIANPRNGIRASSLRRTGDQRCPPSLGSTAVTCRRGPGTAREAGDSLTADPPAAWTLRCMPTPGA